jgi:tetratricopeptide (TPR) repeat protein
LAPEEFEWLRFRAVLEMEANFPRAHMVVAAYVEKRRFADALADLDKWEDGPWKWSWHA